MGTLLSALVLLMAAPAVTLVTAPPAQAAYPGLDGRIAFVDWVDQNYDIYSVEPDGSDRRRLTDDSGYDTDPVWSPNGRRIAFTRLDEPAGLYTMNADGDDERLVTEVAFASGVSWSPDGTKLVYVDDADDGSNQLFVIDAEGEGDPTQLTDSGENYQPAWSPDGSEILFGKQGPSGPGSGQLWLISADGTDERQLTESFAYARMGAWSPDAERIAFFGSSQDHSDIWLIDRNGGNPERVTNDVAFEQRPAFSPEGDTLVFDLLSDLYTIPLDGSDPQYLIQGWAADWQPVVDTDGDGVVDHVDNCHTVANADQTDTDGDGDGDACDSDDDNDSLEDDIEVATGTDPLRADSDSDGTSDAGDNCAVVPNSDQSDGDSDGVGDACDPLDDRSAESLLSALEADVAALDLQGGLQGSLTVKLQNAAASVADGDVSAGCGQLEAFINQVEALAGKKIDSAATSALITAARDAQDSMGC